DINGHGKAGGRGDLESLPVGAHLDAVTDAELFHPGEGFGGARADMRAAPAQVPKIVRIRYPLEHIENLLSRIISIGVHLQRILPLRCEDATLNNSSLPSSAALNPGA